MKSAPLSHNSPAIIPHPLKAKMSVAEIVRFMGQTSFEARNVFRGAELFKYMIKEDDTIWLGIAGAGIAGGMGGMVISLLEAGYIDVICSTGAQIYHDLHFAFDLPVEAISPYCDDNLLKEQGNTRIYDVKIREKETLMAQDEIIQQFVREEYDLLKSHALASWEFNYHLGRWASRKAPRPERSFTITAAQKGVPVFWDSLSNHSIAMNLVKTDREGFPISLSAQRDIFDSAAIAFSSERTGFVELGGGGPKNFIQQTGPTISQILSVNYSGAGRGLQISTALEREGSLSGCTFSEAITWGKYQSADEEKLVQIWGEYSILFPLLSAYVIEECSNRESKGIISEIPSFIETLKGAQNT